METIKVTVFESETNSKIPISKFDDETFFFNSVDIPINELPFLIENFYYLNRSFSINNKRLDRKKESLNQYLNDDIDFIVIDVDKVFSLEARDGVIEAIKNEEIPFILCKSRSYNHTVNFNMKGLF